MNDPDEEQFREFAAQPDGRAAAVADGLSFADPAKPATWYPAGR